MFTTHFSCYVINKHILEIVSPLLSYGFLKLSLRSEPVQLRVKDYRLKY